MVKNNLAQIVSARSAHPIFNSIKVRKKEGEDKSIKLVEEKKKILSK